MSTLEKFFVPRFSKVDKMAPISQFPPLPALGAKAEVEERLRQEGQKVSDSRLLEGIAGLKSALITEVPCSHQHHHHH